MIDLYNVDRSQEEQLQRVMILSIIGSFSADWYRSGDLGMKDEEGFVYVVDRLKDMIISGGENIYPAELETVISRHPGVAEVAVVGISDGPWGEITRAYVVKQTGAEVQESDIVGMCRENLAKYKCVKEVIFLEALPRNASGKILKGSLKSMRSRLTSTWAEQECK